MGKGRKITRATKSLSRLFQASEISVREAGLEPARRSSTGT
jgi:hypothetical protein